MTNPTGDALRANAAQTWSVEIKHGPDGEQDYAWLYRGKEMVATMRTHHTKAICAAMNAALSVEQAPEPVARETHVEGADDGPTIRYNGTGDDAIRQINAIERIAELEAALKPFAEAANYYSSGIHRPVAEDALPCGPALLVGHLRRARAALAAEGRE